MAMVAFSQQTSKNDTDDLHREIARLKEQLRKEKESIATVIKEKVILAHKEFYSL